MFLPVQLEIRLFPAARNQVRRGRRLAWALAALAAAVQPAAAQPAPAAPQARFVVVLDAAHGGDDTGGRLSHGQLEKTFTLAMSVRLRSLLAARGIQVVTTRESDTTVELDKRAEIANHAQAQACLSLHASQSGSGLHLFASSLPPAAPARFSAWKTAQAAWVTRSLKLAGVLNSALLHANMSVTLGRTSLPALDSMTCPAVAVEIAPEQNSSHETTAGLDDKNYQARVAAALAAALLEWRTEAWRTEARP
jgi:N-acetylmuramoyl-L-alanine amidase